MGNIILIGFMGCGKSSVGIRLSYRLRQPVVDSDKEIEKEEKCTVSDIFAAEGEEYFRGKETAFLKKMSSSAGSVIISAGGGLPLREENRKLMHRIGTVVYLRASADTIYDRLKNDTTRPLLQGGNPRKKIEELLAARKADYEQAADAVIDVDGKSFEQIIDEIERAVG